jgi:hypothetical protein
MHEVFPSHQGLLPVLISTLIPSLTPFHKQVPKGDSKRYVASLHNLNPISSRASLLATRPFYTLRGFYSSNVSAEGY